jgi:hypothetical protein
MIRGSNCRRPRTFGGRAKHFGDALVRCPVLRTYFRSKEIAKGHERRLSLGLWSILTTQFSYSQISTVKTGGWRWCDVYYVF